eukprot:gene34702-42021_t
MDANSLWERELKNSSVQDTLDDGVYFYGASSHFSPEETGALSQKADDFPPISANEANNEPVMINEEYRKDDQKSFKAALSKDLPNPPLPSTNTLPPAPHPVWTFKSTAHAPTSTVPCRFFKVGNCKFGNRCRFLHIVESDEPTGKSGATPYYPPNHTDDTGEPKECGICIEPVKSAMFGLLPNCDCKFCLDCIRNWRREGQAESVRLCPLCRKESFFIVPSVRHVRKGPEKDGIIEAYKDSLKKIPCKNLAKGPCPFRASCFYFHDPSLEEKWAREGSRSHRRLRFDDYLAEDLVIQLLRQQRRGDEDNSDEDDIDGDYEDDIDGDYEDNSDGDYDYGAGAGRYQEEYVADDFYENFEQFLQDYEDMQCVYVKR